jgi:quinoprotein glucose dehydrogenase
MATHDLSHRDRKGIGFWWTMLVGIVLVIFGLPIAAGGVWLIALGGSWYYLPAGIGLLLTAYFLFRRDMTAIWVYLITYVATLIWALWEAGFNGWAQVPRLVAPTVVLLLVLSTIPMLRGSIRRYGTGMAAAAVTLAGAFGAINVAQYGVEPSYAQEEAVPEAPEAPAVEETPADANYDPNA